MKIYVVMGNDFPDAVFKRKKDADKYCIQQKPKNPRIHWRVYEFELR